MTTSKNEGATSEVVPEPRPVMPIDIYKAAIKGESDVLVQRLGLTAQQRNHIQVQVDAPDTTVQQIETNYCTVRSNLQSATYFGDTVLHLLVTRGHDKLALKVFQNDISLLKSQNKKLETPLHCAARTGNEKVVLSIIQFNSDVVKDTLAKINVNGDTALHIAAKHGNVDVCRELMKLDPAVAYRINKEGSSPLHIAIANHYITMAQTMLNDDVDLACIHDSYGMFPIHVAARVGLLELVQHLLIKHPNYAELLDPRGRNFYHIAAEENQVGIFCYGHDQEIGEMIAKLKNATDYEGNTPLHIAALKGHGSIISTIIWGINANRVSETIRNKQGLTPLQLCARQLVETTEGDEYIDETIDEYIESDGYKFTQKWFRDVMPQSVKNKWERTQVIGLGSVLITTVSFAAAFTIPGGYNQEIGTPIFARKYMFKAFIIANALAFITGFLSLFALLAKVLIDPDTQTLVLATYLFLLSSSSMILAFGLGLYVMLAPNNFIIAILILVVTLILGSPAVFIVILSKKNYHHFLFSLVRLRRDRFLIFTSHALIFLLIFCLAFL